MKMGENIRSCRETLGLTQEQLGEKLGLQKSAIAKYENGKTENMKRSTIKDMSKLFNVNPAWLLGISDVKTLPDSKNADQECSEFMKLFVTLPEDKRELIVSAMRGMQPK